MTYNAGVFPCGDPSISQHIGCARCATPFDEAGKIPPHMTPYHGCPQLIPVHSPCNGIFPLCATCWEALTPDERWPYYAALLGYQACQYVMHNQPLPLPYVAERVRESVLNGL